MSKIGLFFGGMSNEAEVSVSSAGNVVKNFDYKKHKLVLFYWHKDGNFYQVKKIDDIKNISKIKKIPIENISKLIDIALPMTHGKYGEDGVLQAVFEWQKIRYCGCRVLSSALCMDKALFKEVIKGAKINQTNFIIFNMVDLNKRKFLEVEKEINKKLKLPFYVKPANSGSSVGITKVDDLKNLAKAIKEAGKHDSKIIIEQGLIKPKEIEVAVLGNNDLMIADPGELVLVKDFYNYDDKYVLGQTRVEIPAQISSKQKNEIKKIADRVYKLCDCKGFARIDFFISNNKIYLNEINSLPGFTDISMFPMLMKARGIGYKQLINKIIELAY